MKIIILLLSIAIIVSAVPTNHQRNFHERESVLNNLNNVPVTIKRERKSPTPDLDAGLSPETGADESIQGGSKSERSLGFNKPIIIKKKIGYHLYRDSDEEMAHADPNENCRKQVKVKLCDDEPGSPKNVANCFSERFDEDTSEKEIENSIKTAKEAVENLQRGFNKMELPKIANTEDKELEDDFLVHQHIEAARKALEHVQNNFGNHETLNLQGIASKTENFSPKLSDEEKLAQWKEAIDNIQKNFEIARNIEDAFKVESEHTSSLSPEISNLSKMRESEHTDSNIDLQQKSKIESFDNIEPLLDESGALKKQREDSDDDMFTSPMEQKELKIKLHSDSLKSEKISVQEESASSNKMSEEVSDHAHKQEPKDVSNVNNESMQHSENENLKNSENKLNLKTEKNALLDAEDTNSLFTENEHSMTKSVEQESTPTSETTHQGHLDAKHSPQEFDEDKMKINEPNQEERMKSTKNNHDIAEHRGHDLPTSVLEKEINNPDNKLRSSLNIDSSQSMHTDQAIKTTDNMNEQRILNEAPNMRFANEKSIEPTEIGLTSKQHLNNNAMFEDQNLNKKSLLTNEMRDLVGPSSKTMSEFHNEDTSELNNLQHILDEHLSMRNTQNMDTKETDSLRNFLLMRMAEEKQHKNHLTPPSKVVSEFHNKHALPSKPFDNRQQILNEHPSMRVGMRLSQNQNMGHQLSENLDFQNPLKQWAHENHHNDLSQLGKIATDLQTATKSGNFINRQHIFDEHNGMRMKQHQNMINQATDDHNLHDLFLMRLAQEKQENDQHKSTSEFQNEREFLPQNRFPNSFELANDFGPTMPDHLHMMNHVIGSDMDSAMQPSMHMSMRDSIGKQGLDNNNMHWNHHHHAMARYGSSLPVPGASSGAVGLFPNANTGCGIPLMLSCSPSVVSGSLAKPHPAGITAPAYRSDDDLTFYIKRDATDNDELPAIKIQKSSIPFNHKSELIFEKTQ